MSNTEALWFCSVMALWNLVTLSWKNTKSPVIRERVRESLINITKRTAVMFFWYTWKGGLVLFSWKIQILVILWCEISLCKLCSTCAEHRLQKNTVGSEKSEISACSGDSFPTQPSAGQAVITATSGLQTTVFQHFSFCNSRAATSNWPSSPLGGSGFPALWELMGTALDSLFYICAPAVIPTPPYSGVKGVYRLISLI